MKYEPKKRYSKTIKKYRDVWESGIYEARDRLHKIDVIESLERLRKSGTLEEKVDWLLNRYEETL